MTEEAQKGGFNIESLPWYTVPAALLGIPALIAILAAIWPEVFFDQFVEKYYWGPIRGDTGYNLVNTLTWALLMGLCLIGLTQIIHGLKVKFSSTIIYGAVAWVVAGANFRVLEDTVMFSPPLQYVMITPPIYLLFGLFGVISLLIGVYIQKVAEVVGVERALGKLWFIQAALVLVYTLMWAAEWDQVLVYLNPIHVALFAALNHFVARWWVLRKGEIDARDFVSILAIAPLLMSVDYIIQFIAEPWSRIGSAVPSSVITAPLLAVALTGVVWASARASQVAKELEGKAIGIIAAFAFVMVATLWYATGAAMTAGAILGLLVVGAITTGIGFLAARRMRSKNEGGAPNPTALAFMGSINLLLIASQLMDGFATSIGLDIGGYGEKHVLSAFIINAFESFAHNIGWEFGATYPTFLAFVPIKLGVSLLVVWSIDIYSREDVEKYPTLIGFVKFAIIMVGIGPAVRDFVRLGLGV